MLKLLQPTNIRAKAKCGEIFFHSSTEFTIFCTFCEMKSFSFDDFLLHIQNVHFENNLLKTETYNSGGECNQYLGVNVKPETNLDDQLHEEEIWDNSDQCALGDADFYSENDNDEEGDASYEEETVTVLKKPCNVTRSRRGRKIKSDVDTGEDNNDHSSDEDFKPMLHDKIAFGTEDKECVQCDTCGKSFRNIGLLTVHIARVHDEKLKKEKIDNKEQPCPDCDQILSNRKLLDRHIIDVHEGFKCSLCDKRFKQRHQRKRHEQCHTAERNYTCHVEGCGKSFTEKYYLKRHIDIHTTERNFVCDYENCGKSFHTMRRLRAHQNIHTKPKNLVCDACGYTCRENETLRVHQRVHTGEKPYACEVCEKRFISSSALGEHMASHSTTRPHICKVCNASFARQKALYHHSFLHSDVKKFKCKVCGSAYKQASGLAGHMRKHREEGMMSMLPERSPTSAGPITGATASTVPVPPSYPFITF